MSNYKVVDVEKSESVQTSTKGERPNILVGQIRNTSLKVAGTQKIKTTSSKKLDVIPYADIQADAAKSIVLRTSERPIIGYLDGDINNPPKIIPELASMRPSDPKAFSILEQMIIRDGVLEPLVVGILAGEQILLDGHMRLECIIKHNIQSFKLVQYDIPSKEAAMWWIVELSNSYRRLNDFQIIEMEQNADFYYKQIAKENKRLGGIYKKDLSKLDKAFKPIDRLKVMAEKTKASRTLVGYANYILKHGTPQDKEKCRKGANISSVYKDVKEKRRRSHDYQVLHNAGHDNTVFINPTEGKYINQIHQGDCMEVMRDMEYHGINDLAAVITSSPYNVDLKYSSEVDDSRPHEEYIDWLAHVFYQASKLGRNGMRLINVFPLTTNKKRQAGTDYKHCLLAHLINKIKELNKKYDDCNLLFWGHFNWYKKHAGGRVCQGSMSSESPSLRVDSEYIGVWVKDDKKLEKLCNTNRTIRNNLIIPESERDNYYITTEEYNLYNLQTWEIKPVHDHNHRHPARFPLEIPRRLIKLFTEPQDTILDVFCGAGTTCVASKLLKRNYIGIDKVAGYCQISKERLAELDRKEQLA